MGGKRQAGKSTIAPPERDAHEEHEAPTRRRCRPADVRHMPRFLCGYDPARARETLAYFDDNGRRVR